MIVGVPVKKPTRIVPVRLAAAAVAAMTLLAACSSSGAESSPTPSASPSVSASAAPSASPSPSPSAAPSITPATDLSAIEVTDADTPEIKVPTPWAIASTTTKVLRPATGQQKLTKDSVVTLNYVGVNGRTGEIFDSSYAKGTPATMSLAQVVAGFRLGLDGQTVGSRVLIGMPSSDGYPDGNGTTIEAGDSLLFVVDILSANFTDVVGEAQPPVEGMPTVTLDADGKPVVAFDKSKPAPADLQTATLVKGPGAAVADDSVIQVRYRSWVWATGDEFEDGWAPQSGRLGGLIEGWKQGLKGQTAGSRVLLVVPPALAYPEGRSTSPTLQPGQTLVYVIDILDVQNS